ncbi:MAG: hypothetical protein ACM3SP_12465 [Chloroflexota bacterium]
MSYDAHKLYELLPAIYRVRDAEQGEPLRALLAVIAKQIGVLEDDLDQLYDDQFIETCNDWVVPYIGDLIGYRSLHGVVPKVASPRAEVAHTIAFRRRKGTATILEQLARDVTGWPARVVEYFQLLGWTQNMNHIRPEAQYAPNVRDWEKFERLNKPFDSTCHTIDVRRISQRAGKYNIPNIGIHLWRLGAYRLRSSPAVPVTPGETQRFLFDPLGRDTLLFTRPEREDEITHLAEPINVPDPISRRVLSQYLLQYYGDEKSIAIDGVDIASINICNLGDAGGGAWAHTPPAGRIAIDPVLGRIFCGDAQAAPPRVTYHYGFSADMGGGEYDRAATFDTRATPIESVPAPHATIQDALNAVPAGGVVEITDSGRYVETPALAANAGAKIELRAANEHRPTMILSGDLDISGGDQAEVILNGLLIAGGALRVANVAGNQLRRLRLRHCTLAPSSQPSLIVQIPNVEVEIEHCIIGALQVADGTQVTITNSIVDATSESAVAYSGIDAARETAGGALTIVNSTIIGKLRTVELKLVSNSIFVASLAPSDPWTAPVRSEKKQSGCVRFSYVPPGSLTPRRFRCQPDLEIAGRIDAAEKAANGPIPQAQVNAIRADVLSWLVPSFSSLRHGAPDYGQLRSACPAQIRTGASDESEMGAFHDLFQPQRETNLKVRLEEYLRFGLEAGSFYET